MIAEVVRWRDFQGITHVHMPDPMTNLALFFANPKGKLIVYWHNYIINEKHALKIFQPLQRWLLELADVNFVITLV